MGYAVRAMLWVAFTACLVTGGWFLLHACAFQPWGYGDWHHAGWNACPAATDLSRGTVFVPAVDRTEALLATIGRLETELAAKKAQCPACPIAPVATPPDQEDLVLPEDGTLSLDVLKGCWRDKAGDGTNTATGRKVSNTFCFDETGAGERTLKEIGSSLVCKGSMRATIEGDAAIEIALDQALCNNNGGTWPSGRFLCESSANHGGSATCTLIENGPDGKPEPKENQTVHQFTHVADDEK